MTKHNDKIENNLPDRDGMTVPQGYFDDFVARMSAALPERPEIEGHLPVLKRSPWQRVRPYVYMVAMFAGVWCMLKLFTMFTAQGPVPFESNPIVAEALSNDYFVNEYVISDLNQWDLYDDLMNEGINPSAFLDSIALSQMDVPAEYLQ